MIGIINYGMGNVFSVHNALDAIGAPNKICSSPKELENINRIILPGVGAFQVCMDNLRSLGFDEVLNNLVLINGMPIYGICLGMQVMAKKGTEHGVTKGLGWFDAEVVPFRLEDSTLKVPHVGWNNVHFESNSPMFKNIRQDPDMYFDHSFHIQVKEKEKIDATSNYGEVFTAAIRRDNIFGSQFHPEKSQDVGLTLLENFVNWNL
jgi:imidazole glycerol-phosphate synthase subunit HisH